VDDSAGMLRVGVHNSRGDDLAVDVAALPEERSERSVLGGARRDLGSSDDRAAVAQQPRPILVAKVRSTRGSQADSDRSAP
jgi:hypothetical protein